MADNDAKNQEQELNQDTQDTQEQQTQQGDGDGGQQQPEYLEGMTQKDLDALIDKAFAKGARAGKREARRKEEEPGNGGDNKDDKAVREADMKLQKANDRLLKGVALSLAPDVEISAKGVKVALAMSNFEDCFDDQGDLDEDAVKDVLADFLKEWPELSAATQKEPPAKYAADTGTAQILGTGSGGTLSVQQKTLNKHRLIR